MIAIRNGRLLCMSELGMADFDLWAAENYIGLLQIGMEKYGWA